MVRHASLFSQVLFLVDRSDSARRVKELDAEKWSKGSPPPMGNHRVGSTKCGTSASPIAALHGIPNDISIPVDRNASGKPGEGHDSTSTEKGDRVG